MMSHGYDEDKDPTAWTVADYTDAATFRGGRLLSEETRPGDIATPLLWQCAFGHTFAASPRLVLHGGHWCPECVRDSARYAEQAALNPFLAQLEGA